MTPSTAPFFALWIAHDDDDDALRCERGRRWGAGRRHSMAPVNRALFPRRNFTNLIDRGERIREMIDFLLRCAPVAPSPCLFRVLCFLTDGTTLPRHCRAAIDRVRTNARSKTYTAEFIIYAIETDEMRGTTCKLRTLVRFVVLRDEGVAI